ncbi:MAG: hypothetical protein MT490_13135 [Sphingomonas sp.]|uniref:hypothetical protein n=1 Tax=Sphingomonas sp. TaxID=28214 RepID=UPI0022753810|nr:hypothetical protein [Sphingomonas sp.]MCX8476737.1 hypothetical protein [Sphingomonas sp.]
MRKALLFGPVSATLLSLSLPAHAQVYQTYGAHNPAEASPCQVKNCVYPRGPGEPADPIWPEYWQSDWTMYRVFNGYDKYPPPYPGAPPKALKDGTDYQVSHGASFYDSTWRSASGEGAMMERYDKFCLPIFPIENNYSCKFISLGDTAYFVAGEGRPAWMPRICLFSPKNHPPRRDFISHLPYSAADSQRIGKGGQAYSFWVSAANGYVMQVGASPDRTQDAGILFGYGFQTDAKGGLVPQSFYFSGYPMAPANAPIVSQNYTNFAATQPPPDTWAEVAGLDPDTLPRCQLFDPPSTSDAKGKLTATPAKRAPTWGDIGRWKP